ncbi:MAG: hypothetical protein C0503_06370 [Gemmatimonas sp.]|nr:hypothetical protein [Gemmatimonas sp.]
MMLFTFRRVLRRSLVILVAASLPAALSASHPTRTPSRAPVAATAADIRGLVTDTLGTPLPNATIIVAELNLVTTSNAQGRFVLRGLAPAEYHLNVTLIGFAPAHEVVRLAADADIVVRMVQTPLRLSSVVISGSPTGTESGQLTQAAVELSGRALQRALGSSVAATLAGEAGVTQRYNGPAASMPVIRGLTGDRILVLQDGERAGDLAASASDHGVSVDPLTAQRIEVVRGPASLRYGNNALGGVVNVVTNDIPTVVPSHLEVRALSQLESATPGGVAGVGVTSALGSRGALAARASTRSLGDLRTGGGSLLDGTDSKASSAMLGAGYVGERVTAGAALKWYDFEYGLPSEAGDPEAGVRLAGARLGASGRAALQLQSTWLPYLRAEFSAQDYSHDEIEPDGAIGTNFQLRTQTASVQGNTQFGRARGAIGVQGLFRQYAATGEEALTPAANSEGLGAFVYQELGLGASADDEHAAQLQLGARWDTYRVASKLGEPKFGPAQSNTVSSASGSVGLSLPFADGFSVSGSVARAFRAPTVEELYSNGIHAAAGSYDVGNAALGAEQSVGAELIVRAQRRALSAQVSAYVNRVDNFITPSIVGDTLVGGETWPLNRFAQADAQLTGAEAQVETRIGASLVASAMADVVRGEFTSGGVLPFLPPARIGAGLRWERRDRFLGGEFRHGFAQNRVTGGTVDVATDAYTVVNLSAGQQWLLGSVLHQLTLRADNIGDARYFEASSRIKRFAANPGRNISLVYSVMF